MLRCRAASVAFASLHNILEFSGWPYHQPDHGNTLKQPARAAKVADHTLCVENAALTNYGGQYKTPLPLPSLLITTYSLLWSEAKNYQGLSRRFYKLLDWTAIVRCGLCGVQLDFLPHTDGSKP